ncbi:lipid-binding SYLF domain-containing protein [Massilia horti]|nr:lipid-binding SYLF domain-containing protein [Massilia horti]
MLHCLLLLAASGWACAENEEPPAATRGAGERAQSAAASHVNDAVDVVRMAAQEPGMGTLFSQARGVFIVPAYGRAALGIGASGGAGVLSLRRKSGAWSYPAFFSIGTLSVGGQAGAEGGSMVLLLMNDKAIAGFKHKNKFTLSADAGLTVFNWSAMAQGTVGAGDVIAWATAKGLFGNIVSVALDDVHFNQRLTQDYYDRPATVRDILAGKVWNQQADPLREALSVASGATVIK